MGRKPSLYSPHSKVTPLEACVSRLRCVPADRPGSASDSFATRPDAAALEALEQSYRSQLGLADAELDAAGYAALLTRMVNDAGGDVTASVHSRDVIHVINRRCPFARRPCGDSAQICHIALDIFGNIAARNFRYAKIAVDRLATRAGDTCGLSIILNAERGRNVPGADYDCRKPCAVAEPTTGPRVVARSQAMRRALATAVSVAPTSVTILISGETGTGKELVACAVHANSVRARGIFLGLNCGAIPEGLIESTLFGHERGAFTGATEQHRGFFERAQDGTLFLDEVSALSLSAQSRLLRVLQEGEYERVGGHEPRRTNARIIAATNRPLDAAVKTGNFLADLYYRINIINIHIPPLRERPEDIPALIDCILARLSAKYRKPRMRVTRDTMNQALAYSWPGNVRELENVLERSFLFCPGSILDRLWIEGADTASREVQGCTSAQDWKDRKRRAIEQEERLYLLESLSRHNGSIPQVAADMGLTTRAVYMKLRAHGLRSADYRTQASL